MLLDRNNVVNKNIEHSGEKSQSDSEVLQGFNVSHHYYNIFILQDMDIVSKKIRRGILAHILWVGVYKICV
jgi:hypothetical protein